VNYSAIKAVLTAADIVTADLEARILLEDVAGISKSDFFFQKDKEIPSHIAEQISKIIERRVQGESLGRILGYRDFWTSRFYLSPDTLEPRPDTETLIEVALEGPTPKRILDLGTGTGCILLSLLQEFPDAIGVGVDLAVGACETARQNAIRLGLENRVTFVNGSWVDPLPADSKFDLIVSNPPYIPSPEIRHLQVEVKNHDPILALDGGDDGLSPYKILLPVLKKYLETDGFVLFEFGVGQVDDLIRIVAEAGATLSRVVRDLGGHPRVLKISYGDN
jgi:release factor glutamine methyltransferase